MTLPASPKVYTYAPANESERDTQCLESDRLDIQIKRKRELYPFPGYIDATKTGLVVGKLVEGSWRKVYASLRASRATICERYNDAVTAI